MVVLPNCASLSCFPCPFGPINLVSAALCAVGSVRPNHRERQTVGPRRGWRSLSWTSHVLCSIWTVHLLEAPIVLYRSSTRGRRTTGFRSRPWYVYLQCCLRSRACACADATQCMRGRASLHFIAGMRTRHSSRLRSSSSSITRMLKARRCYCYPV
jgi:hypothetical protein